MTEARLIVICGLGRQGLIGRGGMQRFRVGADAAFTPRDDFLVAVTVSPLTPSIASGSPTQTAIFQIGPNGAIRRHPANVPQILAVLSGSGEVAGDGGDFEPVTEGDAVFWPAGEEHETKSAHGMTVLIVQGPGIAPFQRVGPPGLEPGTNRL